MLIVLNNNKKSKRVFENGSKKRTKYKFVLLFGSLFGLLKNISGLRNRRLGPF